MYHEESDTPAMARTSNLNEELGMVIANALFTCNTSSTLYPGGKKLLLFVL